jgi:hypothetical protein
LIAHTPAAVPAFNQINPARLIAAVGVVIAREKTAVLIEDEVLRIAKAESENLEFRTIRVAAKHAAGVRVADVSPVRDFYV